MTHSVNEDLFNIPAFLRRDVKRTPAPEDIVSAKPAASEEADADRPETVRVFSGENAGSAVVGGM